MKNLCRDIIFTNFVYSMELENVDREPIIKDVYSIKNNTPSVIKSNKGGWQSPSIENELETKSFVELKKKIKEAVDFVLTAENMSNVNYNMQYWININKENDYNVLHNHGNLLLSAVYYPFVPSDDSILTFYRTDASTEFYPSTFGINCRTNMLCLFTPHLFHSVNTNSSEQERMSIAFNIKGTI